MRLIRNEYMSSLAQAAAARGLVMSRTEERAIIVSGFEFNHEILNAIFSFEITKQEILKEERDCAEERRLTGNRNRNRNR